MHVWPDAYLTCMLAADRSSGKSILNYIDALNDYGHKPEVYGLGHNFIKYGFMAMSLTLCDVHFLSLFLLDHLVNLTNLDSWAKVTLSDLYELIEKYRKNDSQNLNVGIPLIYSSFAEKGCIYFRFNFKCIRLPCPENPQCYEWDVKGKTIFYCLNTSLITECNHFE